MVKIYVSSDGLFCQHFVFNSIIHKTVQAWKLKVWKTLTLIGGSCHVDFINPVSVVAGGWGQGLALALGTNSVVSTPGWGQNPVPEIKFK
jgi:hypothetical protein